MANWRYEIGLNQVLEKASDDFDLDNLEEDCPEPVKEMICQELEKAPPLRFYIPQVRKAKAVAAVNRVLEKVFDEADYRKVWCGF